MIIVAPRPSPCTLFCGQMGFKDKLSGQVGVTVAQWLRTEPVGEWEWCRRGNNVIPLSRANRALGLGAGLEERAGPHQRKVVVDWGGGGVVAAGDW